MLVTAVWGSTFLVVHIAVQYSGPWFFVGMRFLAAGVISAIIFARILPGLRWKEIGAGSAIGVMIFLGYGLQTVGLQTIKSAYGIQYAQNMAAAILAALPLILVFLFFQRQIIKGISTTGFGGQ